VYGTHTLCKERKPTKPFCLLIFETIFTSFLKYKKS
jgi:hypothetical protein